MQNLNITSYLYLEYDGIANNTIKDEAMTKKIWSPSTSDLSYYL